MKNKVIFLAALAVLPVATFGRGVSSISSSEPGFQGPHGGVYRSVDARRPKPGVVTLGPTTTYLKSGLSVDEVVMLLGEPDTVAQKRDGGHNTATYIYRRSGGRVLVAEFADDVLVSSRMQPGGSLAKTE